MASRRSVQLFLPWISITESWSSSAGTKLLAPVSPFALHPPTDLCLLLSDGLLLSPLIHPLLRPPILLLLLSSGHCVRKRGCTAGEEAVAATVAMEHHRHRHGDEGCGAPLRILISHALNEVSQVSRSSLSGEGGGRRHYSDHSLH